MIPPYTYSVHEEVLRAFVAAPKVQRDRLLRMFDQLVDNPFLEGDATQLDQKAVLAR